MRRPATLRRVLTWAAAALLTASFGVACSGDSGTGPSSRPGPTRLQLRANVQSDGEDRIVDVGVGYRRGEGEVVGLAVDPSQITVAAGTTKQQAVVVNLVPCLADDARQRGPNGGCNLHVTLRLLSTAGDLIAVAEQDVGDVVPGEIATAAPANLAPPTIALSSTALTFTGTSEFAVPSPLVVNVTSAGSAPAGTLSATVTYPAGAPSGWLLATVDQTAHTVTVLPSATLGAGTYTATVTVVGSTPGVKAQTFTVTFTQRAPSLLTVVAAGSGTGRVTAPGVAPQTGIDCAVNGTAATGACNAHYPTDTTVTLTATAATGSVFAGFTGATCTGAQTCTLALGAATTVTANFIGPQTLTVLANGSGGSGTVTSNVGGINCLATGTTNSGTCAATVGANTIVTLTATPATGSTFAGWTGDCTATSGPCTVTLDRARSVAPSFVLQSFPLTVTPGSGNGSGSITSDVGGITCRMAQSAVAGPCGTTLPYGTVVTLTPTTGTGSTFDGFTGDCTGTGPCTLTIDRARAVGASFTAQRFALTVGPGTGTGAGVVTSPDGSIGCAIAPNAATGTCTTTQTYGTVVTLTATPSATSTFAGWTGACTGTGPCAVTVDAARTVSAVFTQRFGQVTVLGGGNGFGGVTSTPPGITCTIEGTSATGTCTGSFPVGTAVTLTAAPGEGNLFTGWSGACTGTGPCTFTLGDSATVTASFGPAFRTLEVLTAGDGQGDVSSSPGGIACVALGNGQSSQQCGASFTVGSVVTLHATPGEGAVFGGWSNGPCVGTGDCTVTLDQSQVVTATFYPAYRTLTVQVGSQGSGLGSIVSSPSGISCAAIANAPPTICRAQFPTGSAVTLTPQTSQGNQFQGFSGGGCTGTAPCTLTLTQDATVSGSFGYVGVQSVNVFVSGDGTIIFTPDGGQPPCVSTFSSASCTRTYNQGTAVTLTPQPAPADSTQGASTFTGWDPNGPCAGRTGACTVSSGSTGGPNVFINVSASFLRPPTLYVTEPDSAVPANWDRQFTLISSQSYASREIHGLSVVVRQTSGDSTWTFDTSLAGTTTASHLLTRCTFNSGSPGTPANFEITISSTDPGVQPVKQTFFCGLS